MSKHREPARNRLLACVFRGLAALCGIWGVAISLGCLAWWLVS